MTVNHGANLFDISNNLNFNKDELLDFSSNINPFGSSPRAKEAIINNIEMVSIYPDPAYKVLKSSISQYCNCKNDNILLGSGATELISSFINVLAPKKTLLISPAYSEYERELDKNGSVVVKYFSIKEANFKIEINHLIDTINSNNFDLVIICNPNNPTGFAFNKDEINSILNSTKSFVMVDETYIEFTNTNIFSSTSLVDDFKNLFVIRGTSKFFSTPGIRLGYGLLSNKDIYEKMSVFLDLWNINIFATIMGEVMFTDTDYIDNTYCKILEEREYLTSNLAKFSDLKVYESYGNFILCEIHSKRFDAPKLYNNLLHHGIIIRNCSSFEGLDKYFFRVCVLKPEANRLLIKKIEDFIVSLGSATK